MIPPVSQWGGGRDEEPHGGDDGQDPGLEIKRRSRAHPQAVVKEIPAAGHGEDHQIMRKSEIKIKINQNKINMIVFNCSSHQSNNLAACKKGKTAKKRGKSRTLFFCGANMKRERNTALTNEI